MPAGLSNEVIRPAGTPEGPANAMPGPAEATALVLDTNIVLDWLVFDDPGVTALQAAITSDRVRWLASPAMRDELASVLTRGSLLAWQPDSQHIWSSWQRWACIVTPHATAPEHCLRCTDPDDQKFVDLALQVGAQALLSRDRAVLRLARRARAIGLEIMTGAVWAQKYAF